MTLSTAVAVIAYDRPRHLEACLAHLENSMGKTERLPVFIFQDSPPDGQMSPYWKKSRAIAAAHPGATVVTRARHLDVFNVTQSITDAVESFDAVVALEDDVCVSKDFVPFMVESLNRYAECEDVLSVCGEQYLLPELAAQPDRALFARFFLRHGFAVWRRSWRQYDAGCAGWETLRQDSQLLSQFDVIGRSYLSDLLARVCTTGQPVYDIRWYYCIVARGGFSVMPTRSLVFNSGCYGGTHLRTGLGPRGGLVKALARRVGFASRQYQSFYRGNDRIAGSTQARRGAMVFDAGQAACHSDYDARHEQNRRYGELLKRHFQARR